MSQRPDPRLAADRVRTHLDRALDESSDPEVRYALREALQLMHAVETGAELTDAPPGSFEREPAPDSGAEAESEPATGPNSDT